MLSDSKSFSSFAVKDAGEAQTFYGETLGLEVEENDAENGVLTLKLDGGRDVVLYAKPDHEPAVFTVLNFAVADIEGTVDGLTDRGITFERYEDMPMEADERGIHRGDAGPTIAWFTDPSGNILSLVQDGEQPA